MLWTGNVRSDARGAACAPACVQDGDEEGEGAVPHDEADAGDVFGGTL